MTTEQQFDEILNVQIAHYPLLDSGLISDNDLNCYIENLLVEAGLDIEEYYQWKDA